MRQESNEKTFEPKIFERIHCGRLEEIKFKAIWKYSRIRLIRITGDRIK